MMETHVMDPAALAWFAGWLVAVAALLAVGLAVPLQTRHGRVRSFFFSAAVVLAAVAVTILANVGIVLHDLHVDLTREKLYTPAADALAVAERLDRPVRITYFYRGEDAEGRRTRDVLELMGRRNPLLAIRTVDPDREPAVAQAFGIRLANAAVVEAEGRKVVVQSIDEREIAIGIQRVLRERVPTVCFVEGHNELPMDNFEFHTHVEGVSTHTHGDSSSRVVQTTGHGIGRLRRILEAQGYDALKVVLATSGAVPAACGAVVIANPRTAFLPAESDALAAYVERGGALLAMLDLGFFPEPRLAGLLRRLGVVLPQVAVVDPLNHYARDAEMVAVAAYENTPVTRSLSMTFFPGVRPLQLVQPEAGVTITPLFLSSRDSYVRPVRATDVRAVDVVQPGLRGDADRRGPSVLGAAAEGALLGGTGRFRAVVIGDGDFASNSFLPYLANGDLALSSLRWLLDEDKTAAVKTRIPVPPSIELSRGQMKAVFLAIVVLLPVSVLAMGGLVWWRRR